MAGPPTCHPEPAKRGEGPRKRLSKFISVNAFQQPRGLAADRITTNPTVRKNCIVLRFARTRASFLCAPTFVL